MFQGEPARPRAGGYSKPQPGKPQNNSKFSRDPFDPFRIKVTSGDAYDVRDPNSVALGKNRPFITFPDGEKWTFVPYLHISASESVQTA